MQSTETLELACADAWRPVVENKIGDWRLRAASDAAVDTPGARVPFTGRANSALAVGEAGVPTGQALTLVRDFAHSHGIPPVVQAVLGSDIETELASNGWRPKREHGPGHLVSVQTSPLPSTTSSSAAIRANPTPGWWELAVGTPEPTPAQRHVLGAGDIGYGHVITGDVTAGAVRAALVGDVLYISSLAVRRECRRMGLATDLMAAAASWGRERGARSCALQVAVGNPGALALYSGLGFAEHHRYRYWVPAETCEDP